MEGDGCAAGTADVPAPLGRARDGIPADGTADSLGEGGARLACVGDRELECQLHRPGHRLGDVDRDECVDTQIAGELLNGAHDLAPHDRVLGAVVFELLAQFPRGVERVVLDDNGSQAQDRVERDDVLRAGGQHERDRVACPDAVCVQGGSSALDLLVERPIARRTSEELQRGSIGIIPDGCRNDVDE